MNVEKIEWKGGGYDLHLIAGTEIDLLTIYFVDGTSKLVSDLVEADKVSVKFNWTLKFKLDDPDLEEVEVFGIIFEVKKGILHVKNPLPNQPEKRVYNFIMEVTVEDKNVNNTFSSAVRIHVHDDIVDAWLTPSKLSIRQGSDRSRFSILATFVDNVDGEQFHTPGDISRSPEYSHFIWKSSNETKVTVDSIGRLTAVVSNASNIEISTILDPSAFGGSVPEPRVAKVDVLPSWEDLSTEVRLVGGREISQQEIEKYPNLLFIAEGYKVISEFENDVDKVVEEIKRNTTLMPFNLLSSRNKLNYWSVFVASIDELTTYLGPLLPYGDTGWFIAGDYFAVKPDPNDVDHEWTLNELVYVVGMPLLSDYSNPQDDYDDKTKAWSNMFDTHTPNVDILRAKKAKRPLWERWKLAGLYGLANEKNTALGTSASFRPNVDLGIYGEGIILLNPFRMTRVQLNQFLKNLKTKVKTSTGSSEFPIGDRWATGPDRKCVIALCNTSPFLGTEGEPICVSAYQVNNFLNLAPGTTQIEIQPAIATKSFLDIASTVCHEFGHTLDLQNENGGLDSMPANLVGTITDAGNVQAHSELVDSSGGVTGINGKNIKWNWPRIMKAGVLKEYLPSGTTELKIRLDNDYRPKYSRDYFNTNNNVRFRQRMLPTVETSMQEFHIDSIGKDPQGDILTLKPLNSEAFEKSDFPIGSLVIVTRPETLEFPEDKPYMRIIHKAVLNHINVTKRPLTAPPPPSSGNVTHDCVTVLRSQLNRPVAIDTQTPKNIPLLRFPKRKNHCTIAGVYEGGLAYECNVYHPSGYCNYRSTGDSFCHVCRYFIVDKLDPTLHRDIDHQYENIYPFR